MVTTNKQWNNWYARKQEQLFGVKRPIWTYCEICGENISGRNLHLDHNHQTGQFRGWLCFRCNQFLGFYEKFGWKVKEYLDNH